MGAALYLPEKEHSLHYVRCLNIQVDAPEPFTKVNLDLKPERHYSLVQENGLFKRWIDQYQLPVEFQILDPIIDFRTKDWSLPISPDRETTIERFLATSRTHQPSRYASSLHSKNRSRTLCTRCLRMLVESPLSRLVVSTAFQTMYDVSKTLERHESKPMVRARVL